MPGSIYWYDYETFGIDPRLDRIAQFGGIRTDEQLNIISDPLVLYCKPADDVLPDPQSCLITKITPQLALEKGLIEAEFIAAIHQEFSRPDTCIAGYNNIRFDDEFTRNCLYRNFYNPYAHEWQQNNSRWDLIDIVRLTRALRPEGINWPLGDDGRPSARLEHLTRANNLSHDHAHDAMSDVYATIEMARLIMQKQPRLFEYMYSLRRKNAVLGQFNMSSRNALLHVSSRYSAERNAIAMVMPVCMHPFNKNSIIVYDLSVTPDDYIAADADELAARLFTRSEDLPEDVERIPLKEVHVNKCPVIVPVNTMDDAAAQRLGIDIGECESNREKILQHIEPIAKKTVQVFSNNPFPQTHDPDTQIYSGGFFSDADYGRMERIRQSDPDRLAALKLNFDDKRLPEMLFRYRARNFPHTLSTDEQEHWQEFRRQKLTDPAIGPRTLNQFFATIESLRQDPETTGADLAILDELYGYGENLLERATA